MINYEREWKYKEAIREDGYIAEWQGANARPLHVMAVADDELNTRKAALWAMDEWCKENARDDHPSCMRLNCADCVRRDLVQSLRTAVANAVTRTDQLCTVCGRDNRNGTHVALEVIGHLSHRFTPPTKVVSV